MWGPYHATYILPLVINSQGGRHTHTQTHTHKHTGIHTETFLRTRCRPASVWFKSGHLITNDCVLISVGFSLNVKYIDSILIYVCSYA